MGHEFNVRFMMNGSMHTMAVMIYKKEYERKIGVWTTVVFFFSS